MTRVQQSSKFIEWVVVRYDGGMPRWLDDPSAWGTTQPAPPTALCSRHLATFLAKPSYSDPAQSYYEHLPKAQVETTLRERGILLDGIRCVECAAEDARFARTGRSR